MFTIRISISKKEQKTIIIHLKKNLENFIEAFSSLMIKK